MKKLFKSLSILAIGLTLLTGCNVTKTATSYYIDSNNNLIVVYDDNSETNLGAWGESIIDLFTTITVSSDGYYVINGVKTNIKENTPITYYLDSSGNLIAKYADNTTKNLGQFRQSVIQSLGTVSISTDGYYVINGIKTSIKAKVPNSYSIDSNGHLIVTYTDGTYEDLGDLSESLVNGIQTIEVSEDGYYVINGVKTNIKAIEIYTVSFNTGFSKTIESQKVKDGYKVTRPEINRTGYTLDGWFCNGEEWRFNSDVVKNDMTLTAEWTANEYTVSFINEKGTNPEDLVVTYDSSIALPSVASVDGYTFGGWYNGTTKINDGKWTIASDVTLTAKWTTNEYTITLDPGVGSVSKTSVTVKYNEAYTLPVPTNTYGVFTGWLLDGEKVTDKDGKSLSNWTYTENKTFTVDWTIKVSTVDDLKKMATYLNGEFILQNDIDMTGADWTSVSNFTGHLDGNGYSITNYSSTKCGLFVLTNNATIENLNLNNVNVDIASTDGGSFGALVCIAMNTTIKDVSVSGIVKTPGHSSSTDGLTGGIVGYLMNCTLNNIEANVEVTGTYNVGGIAGTQFGSSISKVTNKGSVTSKQGSAGGVIGYIDCSIAESTSITNAKNTGSISGGHFAGGIVGSYPVASDYSSTSSIYIGYSCNYGTVSGGTDTNDAVGGLIGNVYTLRVEKSYNRGDITKGYASGGLCGMCYTSSSISSCYNSGNVTGTFYAGGFAGYIGMSAKISESVVFGTMSSSTSSASTAGSAIAYATTNLNVYYNCSAQSYFGTKTTERYSSSFYKDYLYWKEYDSLTKKGDWIFSDSNYPTLAMELDIK